jgi:hypothetical protein
VLVLKVSFSVQDSPFWNISALCPLRDRWNPVHSLAFNFPQTHFNFTLLHKSRHFKRPTKISARIYHFQCARYMLGSLGFIALVTTYLRISELQVLCYFETWKNEALVLGFWIMGVNCIAPNPKYMSFHRAELGLSFHFSLETSPLTSLHARNSIGTTNKIDFPPKKNIILSHVEIQHKVFFFKNGTYCLLCRMYLKDTIILF